MADTWLVVGLGNPGPAYTSTRHNIGVAVVTELARREGVSLKRHHRVAALAVESRVAGVRAVLATPTTYMNDSGGSVKALAGFYKVPTERLVVLHDELDIEPGAIRVKWGGGDNGHNGLKSVRAAMGTGDWFRVRLGIGRPPGHQDPADFVLRPFSSAEQPDMLAQRGADAVESLVVSGLAGTQNEFNS